jgi:hypothetical protein
VHGFSSLPGGGNNPIGLGDINVSSLADRVRSMDFELKGGEKAAENLGKIARLKALLEYVNELTPDKNRELMAILPTETVYTRYDFNGGALDSGLAKSDGPVDGIPPQGDTPGGRRLKESSTIRISSAWYGSSCGSTSPEGEATLVLQTGSSPYSPTSGASGIVSESTTGFAKLSDAAINALDDGDAAYDYFKLVDDVDAYVLTQSGSECQSSDTWLGWFSTVQQCADACRNGDFCRYFIYGTGSKAGNCYEEYTDAATCPEGWESDEYDFYHAPRKFFGVKWGSECKSADLYLGAFRHCIP